MGAHHIWFGGGSFVLDICRWLRATEEFDARVPYDLASDGYNRDHCSCKPHDVCHVETPERMEVHEQKLPAFSWCSSRLQCGGCALQPPAVQPLDVEYGRPICGRPTRYGDPPDAPTMY